MLAFHYYCDILSNQSLRETTSFLPVKTSSAISGHVSSDAAASLQKSYRRLPWLLLLSSSMDTSSEAQSVTVTLQFFAKARELLGRASTTATLPASLSYSDLLLQLNTSFPSLEKLGGTFVLSLNEEYLEEEEPVVLHQGDELAVIPPLSGG